MQDRHKVSVAASILTTKDFEIHRCHNKRYLPIQESRRCGGHCSKQLSLPAMRRHSAGEATAP